jgi:hypothetical protein
MVSRVFVNAYACAPELDVPYPMDGIQEPPSYRLRHQLYRISTVGNWNTDRDLPIRLTAGEAGFLPSPPLADIVTQKCV